MKSTGQIAILIVVVAGLIGVVTFVSQYNITSRNPNEGERGVPPVIEDLLAVPANIAQWDLDDPNYAKEYELHATGHYAFWFENRLTQPVEVSLREKDCTCAEVRIGVIPEEAQAFPAWAGAVSACLALTARGQVPDPVGLAGHRFFNQQVQWQHVEKNKPGVMLPAASDQGPVLGLVRLSWKSERRQLGPQRLTAVILGRQPNGGVNDYRLEVPIHLVSPVRTEVAQVNFRDFHYRGETQRAEFACWSATRPSFSVTVREAQGHPCFVTEQRPLRAEELDRLVKPHQTRPRSGYLVAVTVHERRSETERLDLGPFRRRLQLASDVLPEPLTVEMTGLVRGEVTIGTAGDGDRVNLGNFSASGPVSRTVVLTSDQRGLLLEVESRAPEYLEVKLEEDRREGLTGKKRWLLRVAVPADRASGRLPPDSGVVLRSMGQEPLAALAHAPGAAFPGNVPWPGLLWSNQTRRIRIPITGNAFR